METMNPQTVSGPHQRNKPAIEHHPLRDYQLDAVNEIRSHYKQGTKKVLLHLSTGAGKTVIFSHIMSAASKRGFKCIMVVRGRDLVDQASQRLFREKIEHGVRMNNHWLKSYGAPIQICSADTLISRKQWPEADVVVIDECDLATSEGFQTICKQYPSAFYLGVTATPYVSKSMRHFADVVVHPITIQELVSRGFLVPPRYYAPSAPNLNGVKIVNDDFQVGQLEERMGTLTGDIVQHWSRIGMGRPTVCFAVRITHSHNIVNQFLSAGIRAEHIDANSSDEERQAALKRLESGDTKVLSNVGILGRGVDIPFLGCVIMARPTRSYNLYIQQAGRGTRPFPGKKDFILLDHSGNLQRHGYIDVEPPVSLDGVTRTTREVEVRVKVCTICYLAYQGADCPECGYQERNRIREVEIQEGILKEIVARDVDPILQFLHHAKSIARQRGYKAGWMWHKAIERFGLEAMAPHLPAWFRASSEQDDPFRGSPFRGMR